MYNVMVEWESGEITTVPLEVLAKDDPVACAIYAKENQLLEKPGWKRFKGIAKQVKRYFRMVKQAKLRSFHQATKFKYGVEIPCNYVDAIRLDKLNGNTLWADAIRLELSQIMDYECFEDRCLESSAQDLSLLEGRHPGNGLGLCSRPTLEFIIFSAHVTVEVLLPLSTQRGVTNYAQVWMACHIMFEEDP